MEKEILYQKIYNDLLQAIRTGVYPPGSKIPSEKNLSEQYDVSRITSRKALEMLMERNYIIRIPGRGSFVMQTCDWESDMTDGCDDVDVTEMDVSSNNMIGVVVDRVGPFFGSVLIGGIERECAKFHYHMVLKCTHGDAELEAQALDELVELGVKGIILMVVQGEVYNPKVLQLYIEKFPMVLVDRELPGLQIPCVCTDNYTAAKELVSLLIEDGHKEIAYLSHGQSQTSVLKNRFLGYLDGVCEHQLVTNENLWLKDLNGRLPNLLADDADAIMSDAERIKAFILDNPQVTGFFAVNYPIGILTYWVLHQLNMDLEKEVVFFDGVSKEQDYNPMFNRIVQEEAVIGAAAVRLLKDKLKGKEVSLKYYIPYTVVKKRI